MTRSICEIGKGGEPAVWLDYYDYAATLLAHGHVPWFDQAQFASFHSMAQSLLRSDVISLSLEPLAAAWLSSNPILREAMKAKSRPGFPLRILLQDSQLRENVSGLLSPLRSSHGQKPLALVVPSPRRWLASAYQAAHGEALEAAVASDADEIDGASVFLADFLRSFAESDIDALVLMENPDEAPASEDQLSWYDPVINTARHYRWQIGVLDPAPVAPLSLGDTIDFCIAPSLAAGTLGGLMLDVDFWQGGTVLPLGKGQFRYAIIPLSANPETVLQQLARLR